ncbi:10711_t:CDS:2 [Paraglomus occultum]|uniref:10711_t:CDS:1 n=1 Tax=Paraglomus occultum TaxID=144539 RepID=A0A9N8ZUN2_9GLOM|nr:10711_t:CDS:2 [Paraglomus occultum]
MVKKLLLKFTTWYNEAAHELCTKDSLAPKLLGVEEVSKGLKISTCTYGGCEEGHQFIAQK